MRVGQSTRNHPGVIALVALVALLASLLGDSCEGEPAPVDTDVGGGTIPGAAANNDEQEAPDSPEISREEETHIVSIRFVTLGGDQASDAVISAVRLRNLEAPSTAIEASQVGAAGLQVRDGGTAFLVWGDSIFPLVVYVQAAESESVRIPLIEAGAARFHIARNGIPEANRVISVHPPPKLPRLFARAIRGGFLRPLPPLVSEEEGDSTLALLRDGEWEQVSRMLSRRFADALQAVEKRSSGGPSIAAVFGLSGPARATDEEGDVSFPWLPAARQYKWQAASGPPLLDATYADGGVHASWLDFHDDGSFTAYADRPAVPLGHGAYFSVSPGSTRQFNLSVAETGSIRGGWREFSVGLGSQSAHLSLARILKGPQGQDAVAVSIQSWELGPGEGFTEVDLLPGEYRVRGIARCEGRVKPLSWAGYLKKGETLNLGLLGSEEGQSVVIEVTPRTTAGQALTVGEVFVDAAPTISVRLSAVTDRVILAPKLDFDVLVGGSIRVVGLIHSQWRATANDRSLARRPGFSLVDGVGFSPIGQQSVSIPTQDGRVQFHIGVETQQIPIDLSFDLGEALPEGEYQISFIRLDRVDGGKSVPHEFREIDGSPIPGADLVSVPCVPGEYRVFVRKQSQGDGAVAFFGTAIVPHTDDPTRASVEMMRGTDISGLALDLSGIPVRNKTLTFFLDGDLKTPIGDPAFVARTDDEGKFQLLGVPSVAHLASSDGRIDVVSISPAQIELVVSND